MKKLFYVFMSSIVAIGLMAGCSKEDDPQPQNPNEKTVYEKVNLTIRVDDKNDGSLLGCSGAVVKLYASSSDYEKGVNCIATGTTNSSGDVTFLVESEKTYYFSAEYLNKTNQLGGVYTYCSNESEYMTVVTYLTESVGTVVLNNNATGSDSGTYKFVVKNTTTGYSKTYTVKSGSKQTLTDMPLGSYTVYMQQQDGYTFYATDGTMTGTLNNAKTITFSTANL